MLQSPEYSFDEIARSSHTSPENHFSKVFKKHSAPGSTAPSTRKNGIWPVTIAITASTTPVAVNRR